MDFDTDLQYLKYEEYRALGGKLDETPFNLLEFNARKQIDLKTQNRLKTQNKIPQQVKICAFHLIDKIEQYIQESNTSSGNIASESIDGYSVSYITATQVADVVKSRNFELQDVIINDLYGLVVDGIHIIYNGVK